MPMTPVIPVDYGAQLNSARTAYHKLMTGTSARVFVDQNGERVEYTSANSDRLRAYIVGLEKMLGINSHLTSAPMRVFF